MVSPYLNKPTRTLAEVQAAHDKPLAIHGLRSYRCAGRWGWVVIGATDHDDALNEAKRSIDQPPDRAKLQIWNGVTYVPIK